VPSNRERKKIGIGEQVTCSVDASVGSVTWSVESGGGTVSTQSGLSTTFTAPDRAATCVVKAITSDDEECSVTFNVVEPSGVNIVQEPGTGVWHTNNTASVGFKGRLYILPADVSFQQIEIREEDVAGVGVGYLSFKNGEPHGLKNWIPVDSPTNDTSGSKVNGVDTISSGTYTQQPYSNGTFTWAIPWEFRVGTGSEKEFSTVTHKEEIDANGNMTISKGGASKSKNYADPDSNY